MFLFSSVFSGFGPVCSNFFVGRGEAVTFCRIWTSLVKLVFFFYSFFFWGGSDVVLFLFLFFQDLDQFVQTFLLGGGRQ